MVLPVHAARYTRLGFDPANGAGGRDVGGAAPQAFIARGQEWHVLRFGQDQRKISASHAIRVHGYVELRF